MLYRITVFHTLSFFFQPAEEVFKQENQEDPVEAKHLEIETAKDVGNVEFVDEVNTMKSKLNALELKLSEVRILHALWFPMPKEMLILFYVLYWWDLIEFL